MKSTLKWSSLARGTWIEIVENIQNIGKGKSSLARGTWIEIPRRRRQALLGRCRPSQEGRGLKFPGRRPWARRGSRRPSQEGRGLKLVLLEQGRKLWEGRPSQEGRGLKYGQSALHLFCGCRPSQEGRGLKFSYLGGEKNGLWSSLARGTWIEIRNQRSES